MKKAKDNYTLIDEVTSHYDMWTDDRDIRLTRKYGWNDITDSYYGKLPADWPYSSKTVDPRIRTAILEKNARLVNGKLRGRLMPREGADIIGADISNTILDQQWDNANYGGTMNAKIAVCDLDTRLYASKFALVKWKTVFDDEGNLVFDGNEFEPLDIRDCGIDPSSQNIRNAKWFQHSAWEYLEDLKSQTDHKGEQAFQNMAELERKIKEKQSGKSSQRKNKYTSRIKEIKGLEDRMGEDIAFPVVEIVTEYRKDRWITFSPEYKIILRDIPNPYHHGKIPVVQLKYYPLQDDPLGESEVEAVIPLWRAIQAVVCGYMDEVILKQRPPLKVIEGAVKIETLEYGPEAQILVTRPDAVTEMQSNGEAIRYFQTTYSALIAAFNAAMGMLSQGSSGIDPFNPEKTATEVRATEKQANVRDQKNQNDLGDFIKDIMLMWCANNKQFLFSDPKKRMHILRIVGREKYERFIKAGLAESELPPEVINELKDIIEMNPDLSDEELINLAGIAKVPKYPVVENPEEKDVSKQKVRSKLKVDERGEYADLAIVPEDLEGTMDYIPDIKSMSSSYGVELAQARQQAIALFLNDKYLALLQMEGFRPKIKELTVDNFNELGLPDADRYFDKLPVNPMQNGQPNQGAPGGVPAPGGIPQNMPVGGLQNSPQAPAGAGPLQQMAGPSNLPR